MNCVVPCFQLIDWPPPSMSDAHLGCEIPPVILARSDSVSWNQSVSRTSANASTDMPFHFGPDTLPAARF